LPISCFTVPIFNLLGKTERQSSTGPETLAESLVNGYFSGYGRASFMTNMTNPAQEEKWLVQHIPHRVRACLAHLPLQEELVRNSSEDQKRKITQLCVQSAVHEGRMVGIRWLIEFIA